MSELKTIQNRIEKNYKHRKKWANREGIEAFRIYEKDIPEFPFLIDLYKDFAIIYEKRDSEIDAAKFDHFNYIISAVKNILNITEEKIIIKSRIKQKGSTQYEKLENKNEYISIREYSAHFLINLYDYLDTGLFLDHRPLRQIIFHNSENKKVLNLFSYTGAISVMAALGKARQVTSVDMSTTYQDWAKKNFLHNQLSLSTHHFITEDTLKYLEQASQRFDLIILDPPTFSNSKKMAIDFEVEKDQFFLIKHSLRLLSPEGILYFSNNKRKFKLSEDILKIAKVEDISSKTIPEDFRDQKIHHTFKIQRLENS